ncbi:MAG: hypothetical protein ABFS02_12065, partial [Pseudomonadota bacterium]
MPTIIDELFFKLFDGRQAMTRWRQLTGVLAGCCIADGLGSKGRNVVVEVLEQVMPERKCRLMVTPESGGVVIFEGRNERAEEVEQLAGGFVGELRRLFKDQWWFIH